ncbi:probable membrane-associated kinase regulator 4 [Prosopis cineraria]|uniref:probable membrane-associated kinase regulator 4 n=1 Tax=Prosopis cineraria TaxID=364024 RepID=UPI00241034CF|nr:probable membrane-associated kinase regulator 4 [Prosopis cineraria]
MAAKEASFTHVDEHFIHLELSSSDLISHPIGSPPQNREFEFQITSVSHEKESSSSLADELFHKGKLLPLHLLNNSNAISESALKGYGFPLPSPCPSISPSESCMAMSEVDPDKFLSVLPSEINGVAGDPPRKSWSKKLRQIKQSSLGQRLQASRAYVQSLFRKYDCSDKSCVSASNNAVAEKKSKTPSEIVDDTRHRLLVRTINRELIKDGVHARSLSGVIRHSVMKASSLMSTPSFGSLSSSFSLSSSSRSSSAHSDRESSIEGAIAHCKQSQQQCSSTKVPDAVRLCSESASAD